MVNKHEINDTATTIALGSLNHDFFPPLLLLPLKFFLFFFPADAAKSVSSSSYESSNPSLLPLPAGFNFFEYAYGKTFCICLVAMLVPKLTHMPADAISHMVDFAFHVGFY